MSNPILVRAHFPTPQNVFLFAANTHPTPALWVSQPRFFGGWPYGNGVMHSIDSQFFWVGGGRQPLPYASGAVGGGYEAIVEQTTLVSRLMALVWLFCDYILALLGLRRLFARTHLHPIQPDGPSSVPYSPPIFRAPAQPGAVAANETARAYGDPHIVGGDGERYDFNDHGVFNLLRDRGVNLNAEMGPAAGEASVITNVGLRLGNQSVQIRPDGQVTIDGRPQHLPEGRPVTLANGSVIWRQGSNIHVATDEYDMTFTQRASGQYLDVTVNTRSYGVMADGIAPSGILGETFDADSEQTPHTRLAPETYRRSHLFA